MKRVHIYRGGGVVQFQSIHRQKTSATGRQAVRLQHVHTHRAHKTFLLGKKRRAYIIYILHLIYVGPSLQTLYHRPTDWYILAKGSTRPILHTYTAWRKFLFQFFPPCSSAVGAPSTWPSYSSSCPPHTLASQPH